jgi:LmbE family N-acetylglucosaminyl deacetylase
MKKIFAVASVLFLLTKHAAAQMPESLNASDILLRMRKLQVLGSVLYIAAHPDDENTRLLAWLSKDQLYKTGYLSLTRGDGGQNLIGDEQGVELGLIRTQELLAARRIDGAEQYFSRAFDFGFSKTTAESLKIWNEQKILSDVVWIIRKFQPDIIITRFPEDKRAGHGQHSASSVLARLAYSAAADPKQFPEQFAFGVKSWQARRLFWNNYNFGNVNTTREDQLKINVGGFNPLIGKSYGEIAADSRSQHRSQGFGVAHSRGNQIEYFSLTEGEKADSSLMQEIDCSWSRIPNGAAIGQMIGTMIRYYNPAAPYQSLQSLVEIYKAIKALPESYWRDQKLKEAADLVMACSGLWMEATVSGAYAASGQTIPVTITLINRSTVSLTLNSVSINKQDTNCNQLMQPGINYLYKRMASLKDLPISQPYWLREPMSPGSYNVQDQTLIGMPQNLPEPAVVFQVSLMGEPFLFTQRIYYKFTDPVHGEQFQPLTIVPTLMAYCDPGLLIFSNDKQKQLAVVKQSKTNAIPASSTIGITAVPGFTMKGLPVLGNAQAFMIRSDIRKDQNMTTWATQSKNGITDTLLQCRTISYEHIPRIDYFRPSKSTLVSVNLETRGSRIGYIEGAGDKIPDVLTAMGYTVLLLNENSVTPAVLQNLDAVIAGVRAYDVRDWLASKYSILMEYVKNGGNLIVQYNRNLGDDTTGIGPYSFGISNGRVTEEDATVHFLQPDHRVLHFPNEITDKDFEGWIQERGIYFAEHINPAYQSIFSMHDSGEPDQNGSLIIANYGKGSFTYTGLVFFRELPAGVPGAYRLFANIIALNQKTK